MKVVLLLALLVLAALRGARAASNKNATMCMAECGCYAEYETPEYETHSPTRVPTTFKPTVQPSWAPQKYIPKPTKAPRVLPPATAAQCVRICRDRGLLVPPRLRLKRAMPPGCAGQTDTANCVCRWGKGRDKTWHCVPDTPSSRRLLKKMAPSRRALMRKMVMNHNMTKPTPYV